MLNFYEQWTMDVSTAVRWAQDENGHRLRVDVEITFLTDRFDLKAANDKAVLACIEENEVAIQQIASARYRPGMQRITLS